MAASIGVSSEITLGVQIEGGAEATLGHSDTWAAALHLVRRYFSTTVGICKHVEEEAHHKCHGKRGRIAVMFSRKESHDVIHLFAVAFDL